MAALEDAAFAERLADAGVPVLRARDVRVRTSARTDGRAARGLSVDLAVSSWAAKRRYVAGAFPPERLRRHKGRTSVDVVIPTKECADTLGAVLTDTVGPLRDAGVIDDVLVVDAGSADGTAEIGRASGARVIVQDDVLAEYGPALGKGDAMWRALHVTGGDIVCFLDGDTANPDPNHLQGLIGPLLTDPSLQLVKGAFDRPLRAGGVDLPDEGGRVTELMARPLLNLHEPRLAGFAQPLAGEFAGRRQLLESIPFPVGYGVEIAVLIDALRRHGLDALAECHLGERPQPPPATARARRDGLCGVVGRGEARRRPPKRDRRPLPPSLGELRLGRGTGHRATAAYDAWAVDARQRTRREHLVAVGSEERILVRTDLVDVELIEAGILVILDRRHVPIDIRTARDLVRVPAHLHPALHEAAVASLIAVKPDRFGVRGDSAVTVADPGRQLRRLRSEARDDNRR